MNSKKTRKIFALVTFILALLFLCGSWIVANTNIFQEMPRGTYVENVAEFSFKDIIPVTDYTDVWTGGEKWNKLDSQPLPEETKNQILLLLNELQYKGITKKEKNEWLGKKYPQSPEEDVLVKDIYSFYPSKEAGGYIYGPRSRKWKAYNKETKSDEFRNITNFHIVQEQTTGRLFLTLYYFDSTAKNDKEENAYSFYLIEDSSKLSDFIVKHQQDV